MACGNQRTVGSPASLAGTSLHTGQPVTLTLKPAPADFGIKFRRVDIPDQPFISADVESVHLGGREGESSFLIRTSWQDRWKSMQ